MVRSSKRLRAFSWCGAFDLFIAWISLHVGLSLIACDMSARAVPLLRSFGDVYMSLMSRERLVFVILWRMDTAIMPMGMGVYGVVRFSGFMYLYWQGLYS